MDFGPSLFDISVNRIAHRNRHRQRKRYLCLFLNDGNAPVRPIDILEFQVYDITCTESHSDSDHYHGNPSKRYRVVAAFPVLFDPLALFFREDIYHLLYRGATGINA